jgi:uncharacterized protein YggE
MTALKDEARRAAVQDAKKRAELLAGGLGQAAGRAIRIVEQSTDFPQPMMAMRAMAFEKSGGASVPDQLAPGEIVVRSTVNIQFELK